MACTESCFLDVSRCVGGMGGGKKDLDVELERLPIFNRDNVRLVWCTHGRTELSTEYVHQGWFD